MDTEPTHSSGPADQRWRAWKDLVVNIKDDVRNDHVTLAAAGVAFHGLLALIPLLVAGVSLYGLLADPSNVTALIDRAGAALPDDVAALLERQLTSIVNANRGALGLGALVGVVSGLWSASSGAGHLIEAVNIAYGAATDRRPAWQRRLVGVSLTLLFVVFVGVAATVIALTSSLSGPLGAAAHVAAWLGLALIAGVLLAVFFRYGPDHESLEWAWVSPGAVFTVVAGTASSYIFGLYVSNFGSYNETYGSLGGVIVLLLWLFVTAVIVIIGAELNVHIERAATPNSEA